MHGLPAERRRLHVIGCRCLAVDDASPAGDFSAIAAAKVRGRANVEIVRNAVNLGFVRTCNWGIQRTAPCDVVLLNSDTLVTPGWLDNSTCSV